MQCGPWNVSVSGALPEMGVHDEDSCPLDLLEIQNPTELDKWILILNFIAKVRCVDGKRYPPRSIHQLLSREEN